MTTTRCPRCGFASTNMKICGKCDPWEWHMYEIVEDQEPTYTAEEINHEE